MLDSIKQKLKQINLIDATKHKKAGVLILLLKKSEEEGYQLLFTKRSAHLNTRKRPRATCLASRQAPLRAK